MHSIASNMLWDPLHVLCNLSKVALFMAGVGKAHEMPKEKLPVVQ